MVPFAGESGRLELAHLGRKDGIRYEMLSERNLEGAVRCVSSVFTAEEPMSRHLGITAKDFSVFAQTYYRYLIPQQLSLVAVDEMSNQVIGVRISEDYAKPEEEVEIADLSPKFNPLFALLDELGAYFRERREVVPGRYAHMFMVAVAEGYTRRGIAPTMYRYFLEIVHSRGYSYAVTEPTGAISQHILLDKFGFHELHRIDYRDFVHEGVYPFAGLRGHTCAMLLEKPLAELDWSLF